jgi:flagellar assembly factor FliW
MKVVSRQFGELEFEDQHVVEFLDGLIGFEQYRKYLILDDEDSEPFRWLVSVENPDLSFPLLDPALLLPDYGTGRPSTEEKEVWVLAALHSDVKKSTVNLRSPIVIDPKTRVAQQMILDDEKLPFQFPLVPSVPIGDR